MNRRMTNIIRMSTILVMAITLFTSLLAQPALAAGETVSVWVTTADQSKLLQQQANVTFAADSGSNPTTIDINEATTYQTMDGFGASLSDSSAWALNQLSAADREALLQALFNPTTGIGLSFLRQPLGGSDFSLGDYAYDDTCCDVNDFSLNNGHDDAYIIPQLQRIKQINPAVKLLGTPWSPPRWMKTNNAWVGGSTAHLQTQYYAAYASYLVKYIQAYAAQGLPIEFLTLQNEPLNDNSGMPAMHMDPGEQANFIKNNVGPAFASAGITTKLLVWDHNWDTASYPTSVLNDAAARAYVAGVAWHCYGGTPDAQTQVRNLYPNLGVWQTECSSGNWVSGGASPAGSFGGNLYRNVQQLVIGSTRNWSKSVVNWNLVLDQNMGPTNGSGACFTCYSVARVNTSSKTWSLDVDYYSLGHVSKFVVPGAVRIDSNTYSGGIENVAFKNPDGSKVLVVINAGSASNTFKVRWGGQSFSYTLPAGAVATFKWSGTAGPTNTPAPTSTSTTVPTRSAFTQIEAESYNSQVGTQLETTSDTGGGQDVGFTDSSDYLVFNNIDFGSGANSVQLRLASGATFSGSVEFRLGSPIGALIGTVSTSSTGGWQVWQTNTGTISGANGLKDLYVVFQGGSGIANVNWFKFVSTGAPTATATRTNTPVAPTATATQTRTSTPTATPASGALSRTGWVATASSSGPGDIPANALDGNATTRWSTGAGQANGQWFHVDMLSGKTFNQITIDASSSTGDYPAGYQVFVSNDGTNWGSAVASGAGSAQLITVSFATQTARYIKVVQTGSSGSWWSLHEFNVYGSAGPTSTPVPTATRTATPAASCTGAVLSRSGWAPSASSTGAGDATANTLDGNAATRWSSGAAQANGQWFQVDMLSARTFCKLTLDAGTSTGDYPRGYQVFVSNDGSNWGSAVASGSGTGQLVTINFATQTARYVRVVQTGSIGNWWSMHELNIYN